MNAEEQRLKTFTNWPANAPIEASRMAKAGFFSTGIGLEVQCYVCGCKINDWSYGDQVMRKNRK